MEPVVGKFFQGCSGRRRRRCGRYHASPGTLERGNKQSKLSFVTVLVRAGGGNSRTMEFARPSARILAEVPVPRNRFSGYGSSRTRKN